MPYIAMPFYFITYFWIEDSKSANDQKSKINNTQTLEQSIDNTKEEKTKNIKRSPTKRKIRETKNKASVVKKSSRNKK